MSAVQGSSGPLLKFGLGLGRGLYAKALLEKGFVQVLEGFANTVMSGFHEDLIRVL